MHPIVLSPKPLKVGYLNSRGVGNVTSTPVHEGMWAPTLRDMVITKLPQDCQQPLYAERMRKLTEQAELEALKERCAQASQSNALMVLSTNNVETSRMKE